MLRRLGRTALRWLFGDGALRTVCFASVESIRGRYGGSDGVAVHVPIGDRPDPEARGALVSGAFPCRTLSEMVAFATRRRLPVRAWILWGLDELPWELDRLAEWLAALASRTPAPVVLPAATLPARRRRRLAARLQRLGIEVETSVVTCQGMDEYTASLAAQLP